MKTTQLTCAFALILFALSSVQPELRGDWVNANVGTSSYDVTSCLTVLMEHRTSSTNRVKVGETPSWYTPSPQRYFLTKAVTGSRTYSFTLELENFGTWDEELSATKTDTTVYSPDDYEASGFSWPDGCPLLWSSIQLAYEGTTSFTYDFQPDDPDVIARHDTCNASRLEDGSWYGTQKYYTNGVLESEYTGPQSSPWPCFRYGAEMSNISETITTNATEYHRTTEIELDTDQEGDQICTETEGITLSQEFTTSMLIARIQSGVTSIGYPEYWNEGSGAAQLSLTANEHCGDGNRLQYHFKFQGETNVVYRVSWQEVTRNWDGSTNRVVGCAEDVPGNDGMAYSGNHEILPPAEPGRVTVENIRIAIVPPNTASSPGTGGPGGGSPPCLRGNCGGGPKGPEGREEVSFEIALGSAEFGASAGSLQMSATEPSLALATPSVLQCTTQRPDVEQIPSDQGLRQVKAPLALADIVTNNAYEFEIRFYYSSQVGVKNGDGTYQLSGSPFLTWTVENPDASPTVYNRWQITQSRDGVNKTYLQVYDAETAKWTVTWPGDVAEESIIAGADPMTQTRTVTTTVKTAGGPDVLKRVAIYKTFSWGEGLIEERVGPDTNLLTTIRHYYPDGVNNGTRIPLQQIVYPDGNWERFEYDGSGRLTERVALVGSGATNAAESVSRVTTYSYSAVGDGSGDDISVEPDTPRTVVESLLGSEVSRRYTILKTGERWDIVCPNPGARWSEGLSNVTWRFVDGANKGRVWKVKRPDSTMAFYGYSQTSSEQTTAVTNGEAYADESRIKNGTKTMTTVNATGGLISRATYAVIDGSQGLLLSSETFTNHDAFGRPQRVIYLDGTYDDVQYACCGVDNTTDRDGVLTQYVYDGAGRQTATLRLNILTTNVLDAAGRLLRTIRKGTDGTPITLREVAYDAAGRVLDETNALGGITAHSESFNGMLMHKSSLYPDNGNREEYYYSDGTLQSITGESVYGVGYEYGVEQEGSYWRSFTKETKLDDNGDPTSEWSKTYSDGAGRPYKTVYAGTGSPYRQSFYNSRGQLEKERDADGVVTLYGYNAQGERAYVVNDLNGNGTIDFASPDRITETTNYVTVRESGPPNCRTNRVTETWVWPQSGNTRLLVSRTESDITGRCTWQTVFNNSVAVTTLTEVDPPTSGNGWTRTVTQTAADQTKTVSVYQSGRLQSVTRLDDTTPGNQISSTSYGYDAHGRRNVSLDARAGQTSYGFNNADQVAWITTPAPGNGQAAQTTFTYYDKMLRATNMVYPDGTSVTNTYFWTGLLRSTFGSRTYPVEYSYDAQGRVLTMKTWQQAATGGGSAVTTWKYNAQRGWLDYKDYPDPGTGLQPPTAGTNGPNYEYTDAGRLKKRIWARGNPRVETAYTYGFEDGLSDNDHGDVVQVSYNNDPASTPSVTTVYDRRGRPSTITRNGITTTLSRNDAGQLTSESYSGGSLNGLSVVNTYDSATLRRQTIRTLNGATSLTTNSYGYDETSRLETASLPGFSATYNYVANSPLVSQLVFKQNTTTRMTTSRQYDLLNRLTQIGSSTNSSGVVFAGFGYYHNEANQRTRLTREDGSYWVYRYDKLGQVVSGKRYWADGTPVAGQQFDYGFDDIGNRVSTKAGGDQGGAGLRSASYSANRLNQYTSRDVPGAVDIVGAAKATAWVSVNSSTNGIYRHGEYFRKELSVVNSSAAVWQAVSVYAREGANQSPTESGNVFVPKTPEAFVHDADGNLLSDGRWNYTWDGENRLIGMQSPAGAPTGSKRWLTFAYDWQGRRIQAAVQRWTNSNWLITESNKLLYDGWNLVAELNATNNVPVRSYLWGSDLSGTLQGAGGVGGLLAVTVHQGANAGAYFCAYDGNGNVAGLVKGADGSIAARYEYGPFGELIRATGPVAKVNPFRFSSKYQDGESDFLYYGYRSYNPAVGRWPNRDPIGERGGINLSGFVQNNPVALVDGDGRITIVIPPIVIAIGVGVGIGLCANNIACRIHRTTLFAAAEGEANRYAPDGTTHWENRAGQQPVAGRDADALVHCISACNMAKNPGPCGGLDRALDWLQRREVGNEIETQLDRINNDNGFAIGMDNPASCTQACLDALRRGLLNEIRNGQIVPSSVEEQHEQ